MIKYSAKQLKSNSLNLIPGIHSGKKELTSPSCSLSPYMCHGMCAPVHSHSIHTHNKSHTSGYSLLLFKFIFYVHWCCACVWGCVRVQDPLACVVSCHIGAGNWTQVLKEKLVLLTAGSFLQLPPYFFEAFHKLCFCVCAHVLNVKPHSGQQPHSGQVLYHWTIYSSPTIIMRSQEELKRITWYMVETTKLQQ